MESLGHCTGAGNRPSPLGGTTKITSRPCSTSCRSQSCLGWRKFNFCDKVEMRGRPRTSLQALGLPVLGFGRACPQLCNHSNY